MNPETARAVPQVWPDQIAGAGGGRREETRMRKPHTITLESIDNALKVEVRLFKSGGGGEPIKELFYQPATELFVVCIDNQFSDTTDRGDAVRWYNQGHFDD